VLPVDSEEGMHKSRKRTAARVLGRQASIEPSLPNLGTLRTISNALCAWDLPRTEMPSAWLLVHRV